MNRLFFLNAYDKERFIRDFNNSLPSEEQKKSVEKASEIFDMLDLFYANKHLYEKINPEEYKKIIEKKNRY